MVVGDTTQGAEHTDTGEGHTDTGEGGTDMVLPALVAGIGALYATGRALDSVHYWNDYKKNTGYSPKYPFMRGAGDSLRYGASAFGKLKEL